MDHVGPSHRQSRLTPNVARSRSMNAKTAAFVRNRTGRLF
jgi:hypothetical protein